VATTTIETNVTAISTGLASGLRPQAAEMASAARYAISVAVSQRSGEPER